MNYNSNLDYMELPELTLYHGDCLEVMKEIPAKSVDLIICDLPVYLPAALSRRAEAKPERGRGSYGRSQSE